MYPPIKSLVCVSKKVEKVLALLRTEYTAMLLHHIRKCILIRGT